LQSLIDGARQQHVADAKLAERLRRVSCVLAVIGGQRGDRPVELLPGRRRRGQLGFAEQRIGLPQDRICQHALVLPEHERP